MRLKTQDKKIKILKSARELFYVRNFSSVSMDDIAKSAGVGKGTIYNYFTSKDDLLLQLAIDVFVDFESILNFAMNKASDFSEFIDLFIKSIFKDVKVKSKILFLFHKDLNVNTKEYKNAIENYKKSLANAFDKFENEVSVGKEDFYLIITNFLMTSYIMANEAEETKLQNIAFKTLNCALKK